MSFRAEITFIGDLPADELARAKILGNPSVEGALETCREGLRAAGLEARFVVKTIHTASRRQPKEMIIGGTLKQAAE